MDHRDAHVNEIRDRVRTGRYVVDPIAVADAILRRGACAAVTPQPGGDGVDSSEASENGRIHPIIWQPRRPVQALAA